MNKNMKINNFKIKIKSIYIFILLLILNIEFSFAQDNGYAASQSFKETANNITNNVLTSASTLLMTGAFVVFFYGLARFIYDRAQGKDGNDLKKGKEFMVWGLIALFVMVSVWGIIKLAQGLLDVESNEIKIQPVKFAALDTSGSGSTGGGANVLKNPSGSDTGGGGFSGTKKAGDSCKVLSGTQSECSSGMYCRGTGGVSIPEGATGTCQNIYESGSTNRLQGAKCTSTDQCGSGLACRDNVGNILPEGQEGTCKPTLNQQTSTFPEVGPGYTGDYLGSVYAYLDSKNCIPSNMRYLPNDSDAYFSNKYNDYYKLAIEGFQKANGLKVDGVVGVNTWPVLVSASAKKCSS